MLNPRLGLIFCYMRTRKYEKKNYIQKHYCTHSLNKIHVGANLNRDETIIKFNKTLTKKLMK